MSFYMTSSGGGDTEKWLRRLQKIDPLANLDKWGQAGVNALVANTPRDSGLAADSWYYEIIRDRNGGQIVWKNRNVENGFPVAVMIQYGHGTGTGGYVQGIDYINPALRPIFEKIAEEVWKAVTSA